jgi:hypothetical protein
MVLGEHFQDNTQDVEYCFEDVAHLDECTYPRAPPHTSWSLDVGQMSTYMVDISK